VVDLYGAVTAVSLCSPVIDVSESCTATISHSQANVLTLTDARSADTCQHAATIANTAAAAVPSAVMVCLLAVVLF